MTSTVDQISAQSVESAAGKEEEAVSYDFLDHCPSIVQTFNMMLMNFLVQLKVPFYDKTFELDKAIAHLTSAKQSGFPLKTWLELIRNKEHKLKERTPENEREVLGMLQHFKQMLGSIDLQEEWDTLDAATRDHIWSYLNLLRMISHFFKSMDREIILEIEGLVADQLQKLQRPGAPPPTLPVIMMSVTQSLNHHPKLVDLVNQLDLQQVIEGLQ